MTEGRADEIAQVFSGMENQLEISFKEDNEQYYPHNKMEVQVFEHRKPGLCESPVPWTRPRPNQKDFGT